MTSHLRSAATLAVLAAGLAAVGLTAAALSVHGWATARSDVWRGGFETGDLRQWNDEWQGTSRSAQLLLTRTPSRDGGIAARFTVRPGERSELALVGLPELPGGSSYTAWSTLFPVGWTKPRNWGDIVQWHTRFPVPAALAVNARGSTLQLDLYAGGIGVPGLVTRSWQLLATLSPGRWHDFVAYIRWSATDGAIQVWHRLVGERSYRRVLAVTRVPRLQFDGAGASPSYLKIGLYRNVDTTTSVVFHDSVRRGPSLAAVLAAGPDPVGGSALQRMLSEDEAIAGPRP